ncbi:MAG: sugar phosphate isomerase/epimerase family protein, partial [Planctomycetota bacterium]
MPALKIGLDLASLRLPVKKALPAAAELGADAVEIDARGELKPRELSQTGMRQLRKMLDDLRLRVSAVRFHTRNGYDTLPGLDARIAATKAAMEFAYDLGASVVVNRVGRVPADSQSDARRLLVEALDDLGRHGNQVGALLAADTGTESGEDLAGLLAELPDGTMGVNLNPGNLVLGGFSALEAVACLKDKILHVHATDAVVELAGQRGGPVSPGQGAADFPALLGALDEHGYRGYFSGVVGGEEEPLPNVLPLESRLGVRLHQPCPVPRWS